MKEIVIYIILYKIKQEKKIGGYGVRSIKKKNICSEMNVQWTTQFELLSI